MKNLRVLWLAPYYEPAYVYGGPTLAISFMCRALARLGVEIEVFTTNANGKDNLDVPLECPMQIGGVQVTYFPRLSRLPYFWSPSLARACFRQGGDFDLLHVNGVFNHLSRITADSASRHKRPFVISPHGMLMPRAMKVRSLKKDLYMMLFEKRRIARAAAIICTDEKEVDGVRSMGIETQLFLVPNGIEFCPDRSLTKRGILRARFQIPKHDSIILMLGRLHPIKRPDLAARAFAQVAGHYPLAHIVFAGPDECGLEENLRKIVQQADAAERLHFTGLLKPEEVSEALADADIFLSTSESENFGMAVIEAMAAGLPVIVSDQIGIARCVRDADAGLVVQLDPQSIGDGLEQLLSCSQDWLEIGQRARIAVMERFDLDIVSRKMVSCYQEVIDTHNSKATF